MTSGRRRISSILSACLSALLVIVACSGGDDGTRPEGPPAATPFSGESTIPGGWQEGSCDVAFVRELAALRSGDTVTGAGEWRIETAGDCGMAGSSAGRETIALNGVRIGELPAGHCR